MPTVKRNIIKRVKKRIGALQRLRLGENFEDLIDADILLL